MSKSLWIVSREYAGLAEAGGLKNVVRAIAEGAMKFGLDVCVFLPNYGCTNIEKIQFVKTENRHIGYIECEGKIYDVGFLEGLFHGVKFVLICADVFSKKTSVYTYTRSDEIFHQKFVSGKGHLDSNLMNVVFQKAVVLYSQITGLVPDVVHCHDGHTALLPALSKASPLLRKRFSDTKFVVTIHNAGAGYHQDFPTINEAYTLTGLPREQLRQGLLNNRIEPFLLAAAMNATITTVSPWYADELLNDPDNLSDRLGPALYDKNVTITGITNGIDIEKYDPGDNTISLLPEKFDLENSIEGKYLCRKKFLSQINGNNFEEEGVEKFGSAEDSDDAVFFVYQGRLAYQKGIDILSDAVDKILSSHKNARFIVMGQGDGELENRQISLSREFFGKYVFIRGYNKALSRLCIASGDFILIPSRFEPCGLVDFIAQIYGTIPIAHNTGGLKKILDGKTGFLYDDSPEDAINRVMILHPNPRKDLQKMRMDALKNIKENYLWKHVIEAKYLPLYFPENENQS